MPIKISTAVFKLLEARGLLPKHCSFVEIRIPPNSAMVLRYEVFITDESAEILSEAFAQIALEDRARAAGVPLDDVDEDA